MRKDKLPLYLTIRQKVFYFLLAFNALGIMIMATYETFAAVYDAVMDDSLYDKWTDFSLRHLPKTRRERNSWNWLVGQEFNRCTSLRLV